MGFVIRLSLIQNIFQARRQFKFLTSVKIQDSRLSTVAGIVWLG